MATRPHSVADASARSTPLCRRALERAAGALHPEDHPRDHGDGDERQQPADEFLRLEGECVGAEREDRAERRATAPRPDRRRSTAGQHVATAERARGRPRGCRRRGPLRGLHAGRSGRWRTRCYRAAFGILEGNRALSGHPVLRLGNPHSGTILPLGRTLKSTRPGSGDRDSRTDATRRLARTPRGVLGPVARGGTTPEQDEGPPHTVGRAFEKAIERWCDLAALRLARYAGGSG